MKKLIIIPFLLLNMFAFAQNEHISDFHSTIQVDTSGLITVEETIRVYALGREFKRGIVRKLPLYRNDAKNKEQRVNYKVTSVLVNGTPANYFTEHDNSSWEIYIGDKNKFLKTGTYYTYTITYQTKHQIGFFPTFDELYWNVNGNKWNFTIDSLSATLHFPSQSKILESSCYTGLYGSTAKDCNTDINKSSITFSATNLQPHEGLTVAAAIPAGIINKPPPPSFFQRNGALLLGGIITLLLSFYYVNTWRKHGKDPQKPTVVPQFDPPNNMSAASVGMMNKSRYWNDLISASIISLGTKGYLSITEKEEKVLLGLLGKSKTFTLKQLKTPTALLPREESILLRKLFSSSPTVVIDGSYSSKIQTMSYSHEANIKKQWNPLLREGNNGKFLSLPLLAIASYVVAFILISPYLVGTNPLPVFFLFVVINIIFFFVFKWLIKRPAERKLQLKADIEGFKMYLSAAEENQIKQFNPPNLTPEIFETYLPYAIALDVDDIWGKKFQALLSKSSIGNQYQPTWYSGNTRSMGNFGHVLNSSLSNSISSASREPSSSGSGSSGGSWSSGSGGGGFSGGGGGGGGGGGW